jgi:tetratricopeptide (TPR) repeat protein
MAITIPLIVLAGLLIFICSSGKIFNNRKSFIYWVIVLSVIFPVIFVIWKRSNLYSAWRHFLFIYPGIILLSAAGYNQLYAFIRNRYRIAGITLLFILLAIHPFRFMLSNPKYSYIYYNQFIGGLKGAYGKFETDYYYVSLKDGSEWLLKYLKDKKISDTVKVASNFSVNWYFRDHPEIKTGYLRYEERSQSDWDFAIIANRYITPYQLKNKIWPPADALKVIYADNVPVCAVLQRKTKDDLRGCEALREGNIKNAIQFYEQALKTYDRDEMIYYYFATALLKDGQDEKADFMLKTSLKINPDFDPVLMYLGNIATSHGNDKEAEIYYKSLISKNRKYFEAYVALAKLLSDSDKMKSRELLRECLTMNPGYLPAIMTLADSYRKSDPDIAKKYDELANTIKSNN